MNEKEIRDYYEKLILSNNVKEETPEHNKAHIDYLTAIWELAELMKQYYTLGENGYPKLGADDINQLKGAYQKVFETGIAFRELDEVAYHPDDFQNAHRIALMNRFENQLAKDLNALEVVPGNQSKTFQDVLAASRSVVLSVDSRDFKAASGQVSTRIPVTYTNEKGEKISGFFTENEHLNYQKEIENLVQKAIKDHPEYEKAFRALAADEDFMINSAMVTDNIKDAHNEQELNHVGASFLVATVKKGDLSKAAYDKKKDQMQAYANRIMQDDTFTRCFYEFAHSMQILHQTKNLHDYDTVIREGSNLGHRNVAMSEIASLFGTSNLLAPSMKMRLVVDGVEKQGVFMGFAKGSDITNYDNPIWNEVTEETANNPAIFKNIADLQVLDFICGNVDRHSKNMFYNLERTENGVKLTGICGIDNDCSMGLLKPYKDKTNSMVGMDDMLVMSAEYAVKIKNMTKEMLAIRLKGLEISEAEITAAFDRLTALKNVIIESEKYFSENPKEKVKRGYIKVVSEKDWETYTLKDLADDPNFREHNYISNVTNYFVTVRDLNKLSKQIKESDRLELENAKELNEKLPGLVSPKASMKMAKAKVLLENNAEGLAYNNQMFDEFEQRMHRVNSGMFISSPEFDAVKEQFARVKRLHSYITPEHGTLTLAKIQKEYMKLVDLTKVYLKKKQKELAKKGSYSTHAKERVEFAKDLETFARKKIQKIQDEAFNGSAQLSEYLATTGVHWADAVDHKPFVKDEMQSMVAMAVIRQVILNNEKQMKMLSIKDFNRMTEQVQSMPAFNNELNEGMAVDLKAITASVEKFLFHKETTVQAEQAVQPNAEGMEAQNQGGLKL